MSLCCGFRLLGYSKRNDRAFVTRHTSLHQNQVLFGKNLNDGKVLSGPADITHMTRHLLVLKNATGSLTKTVRTTSAVKHRSV